MSNTTETESRSQISGATLAFAQPGFGVVFTCPQVGEPSRRSTGPNDPIPIAATGPSLSKNATARPIVSAGVVVGKVPVARRSSGDVPIAHTHFVPPPSMPPSASTLCYRYHTVTYEPAADRYDQMLYRRSGRSGLLLPAVSLGLWQNFGKGRLEAGREIVRRAFDLGVTHFDLANNYGPPYGAAEENFGRLLKKDLRPFRGELVISTKAGYDMWPGPYGEWGSRKYLLSSLDQSLRRLRLDHVDIFYSHRFDPDTPLEETMGALATAVRQGKALYAGISSYSREKTMHPAPSCSSASSRPPSIQRLSIE